MNQHLKDLIEISRLYGNRKDFVIAGGGNTSFKDDNHLWIKASGVSLKEIDLEGFSVLSRKKLAELSTATFTGNLMQREEQVKTFLLNCRLDPESNLRPSVETSLHNLFNDSFVVHTHSTFVNGLMSSMLAGTKTKEIFGDEVLFIPYTDPGYDLFKEVEGRMKNYNQLYNKDPQVVFIQNHGVFVAANSIDEVKNIYSRIESAIKSLVPDCKSTEYQEVSDKLLDALPALRMMLSDQKVKVATAFKNDVTGQFIKNKETFSESIALPFVPDQIVYSLSEYLFIEEKNDVDELVRFANEQIKEYKARKGSTPKVLFFQNEGVVIADDSASSLDYLKDIVNDFCLISEITESFGGPHPLSETQIEFIESWEVEQYRRKVSVKNDSQNKLDNKIIIVTGAAQGFGAGIAEILFNEGANIIVADLNVDKGKQFAEELNAGNRKNKAHYVQVNVADAQSVEKMVISAVAHFGGLDVMISNAGILHAGSLDEMEPNTFELMTKVNYTGYFLCAKYAQKVMKIQSEYKPDHYMDIIQINSKSGLKGSNKNFAYAGGKFGGIGLTQSFALELMPYKIKVNSICPGNFFDGPLWSDPQRGLFVQYLNAGKVPGAKTIADVKAFYEAQVPAGRGCTPEDVAKAIFYVIDQQYETGQAVPVTGGQNMLN